MQEQWRPVKGYEGLYEVSNMGNVRNAKGRILKQSNSSKGYLLVHLIDEEKNNKIYFVHRLVVWAFPEICGEWFEGAQVNHKDEIKTNNVATNLETCDAAYNNAYGTHKEHLSVPVKQYTLDGVFVKSYASAHEASRETGINRSSISKCCRGERSYTNGYKWSFK